MPFTELAIPKVRPGSEVRATFASQWPTQAKLLASQPALIRAFIGSVIRENEISTEEEENKPIIVLGARESLQLGWPMLTSDELEWTDEASFKTFIASEDYAAFIGPLKPLATGPPDLQFFGTDVGPLEVLSAPVTEVVRIQFKDDAESAAVAKDAWTGLVKALGKGVPVSSGTSLNLERETFLGTIGWKSLEVC